MNGCLTEDEVALFLSGSGTDEQRKQMKAHVEVCQPCRHLVESRQAATQLHEAQLPETLIPPEDFPSSTPATGPAAIEGYEVQRELHRGGQGVVYLAKQANTNRLVAIKVLLQGPYASERQRIRFLREIDLAASLQHQHIVTVYTSGTTPEGLHYLVMEYVQGRTLTQYIRSDLGASVETIVRLFAKICRAMQYAHQKGIIHRDIKPDNILIDQHGEPRILDFGLAKPTSLSDDGEQPRTLTMQGDFLGTLAYASPEQASGNQNAIDIRTDVYSLGVVLYELLTAHFPYPIQGQLADILVSIREQAPTHPSTWHKGKSPQAGGPPYAIDPPLEAILLKALAKRPEDRYQSVSVLATDLEHYLAGEPIEARPPSTGMILRLWMQQNLRGLHGALGSILLGLIWGGLSCSSMPMVWGSLVSQVGHIYRKFPSLDPPWIARLDFSSPLWVYWGVLSFALTILMAFSMGLLLFAFGKPRNRWGDTALGLTSGTVAAGMFYLFSLGWSASLNSTVIATLPDLKLITEGSGSVEGAERAAERMAEHYPDLENVRPSERAQLVMTKIVADQAAGALRAAWASALCSLVLGWGVCVPGALAAGHVFREGRRWAVYAELLMPLYITLWFSTERSFRLSIPPSSLLLWVTLLVIAGVWRRWHPAFRFTLFGCWVAASLAQNTIFPWLPPAICCLATVVALAGEVTRRCALAERE